MALNNIAFLVFVLICGLQAATVDWNCASGEWSTNLTCWSTGAEPAAGDDVTVSGALTISKADGVTVNSIETDSGSSVDVTTSLTFGYFYLYYGDLVVQEGATVAGINDTVRLENYYGTFNISGTVSSMIDNTYGGSVNILAGASVTSHIDNSATLNIATNSKIASLTTSGDVNFEETGDGEYIELGSVLSTGGDFVLTNSAVNVTNNFNTTSSTNINGNGRLTLGENSIQSLYYFYIHNDVVVANWGWTESDDTSSYAILLNDNAVFENYGKLILNSRIEFDDPTTAVYNWGEITSDDIDGSDSDACYFYNYYSSSGTTRPNVTNYEGGNVTCTVLRIYYLTFDNQGDLLVGEIDLTGGEDSTIINISQDQKDLYISGNGAVNFIGNLMIDSITTYSGSIYFTTSDGNTTVGLYNSSASNHFTSEGEGDYWIFSETFESTYYEYFESAWVIFEENSNQTTDSYFYFTDSQLWSRGHFRILDSSTWYWNDNSSFINQGLFEVESTLTFYQYTADSIGQFISVGVLKFWDDQSIQTQWGVCNSGLLVLADNDDASFTTDVYLYERFAIDGDIEIEVGSQIAKTYFDLFDSVIIYWSSVVGKYADDFNDKNIPKVVKHEGDYDIKVREEPGDDDVPSFSDIDTCFTATALYITYDKDSTCLSQPDFEKGLCDQDLPPSTVEIANPDTGAASSMIFSVLSVFIIAVFFTLF